MTTSTNQKKFVWEYPDGTTKELVIPEELLSSHVYCAKTPFFSCYADFGCSEKERTAALVRINDIAITPQDQEDLTILHSLIPEHEQAQDITKIEQQIDQLCAKIRIGITTRKSLCYRSTPYPVGILIPYKFYVQWFRMRNNRKVVISSYILALVDNLYSDHIFAK